MSSMNTNESTHVVDVTTQNFQTEVVERSRTVPVMLEFYANEAPPSRELAPVLRRLSDEFQGKFCLARVDIEQNQQLVQQLSVRTLPTLKIIFDGKMMQSLEGPQEETQLRALLDELTMSPVELIKSQIDLLLAQGDRAAAIDLLQQAVNEEPKNYALQVELCDLLIMEGRVDEAKQLLTTVPVDTDGITKPNNRIAFMEEAATLPTIDALKADLAANPGDQALSYQLSVRLVSNDEVEAALDVLLEMLKRDKTYEEELARRTMIKVFDLLGKGNEVATSYRRKMFTFLH